MDLEYFDRGTYTNNNINNMYWLFLMSYVTVNKQILIYNLFLAVQNNL